MGGAGSNQIKYSPSLILPVCIDIFSTNNMPTIIFQTKTAGKKGLRIKKYIATKIDLICFERSSCQRKKRVIRDLISYQYS